MFSSDCVSFSTRFTVTKDTTTGIPNFQSHSGSFVTYDGFSIESCRVRVLRHISLGVDVKCQSENQEVDNWDLGAKIWRYYLIPTCNNIN